MPYARVNDVNLYYEESGHGTPMIFVHEFAGESASWNPQVRFFARRYRCLTYNARGYPPSDVPTDPAAYSQAQAVADLLGLMDHLRLDRAHVVGLSMGGYAALHFALQHPERARSVVIAGVGYGSNPSTQDAFRRDCGLIADRFAREPMETVADTYGHGPTRQQFIDKDPQGFAEFLDLLKRQSPIGHALTMRGVQMSRPSVYDLTDRMTRMTVPALIITGDEDEQCLEPGLFMKRTIPTAALVVLPKSGHTINLEEPDLFNRHVWDFAATVDAARWTARNPASLSNSAILQAAAQS